MAAVAFPHPSLGVRAFGENAGQHVGRGLRHAAALQWPEAAEGHRRHGRDPRNRLPRDAPLPHHLRPPRDLARIAVPTLLIAGELDQAAPPKTMRRMAEAIPGARFVLVPGPATWSILSA